MTRSYCCREDLRLEQQIDGLGFGRPSLTSDSAVYPGFGAVRARSTSDIRSFLDEAEEEIKATWFWPPSGMTMSAKRFEGSTKARCMGRTLS